MVCMYEPAYSLRGKFTVYSYQLMLFTLFLNTSRSILHIPEDAGKPCLSALFFYRVTTVSSKNNRPRIRNQQYWAIIDKLPSTMITLISNQTPKRQKE